MVFFFLFTLMSLTIWMSWVGGALNPSDIQGYKGSVVIGRNKIMDPSLLSQAHVTKRLINVQRYELRRIDPK